MWWFIADVVLLLHILIPLVLAASVIVAAAGRLHHYRKLSVALWSAIMVNLVILIAPGCILADIERWLRHMVEPEWGREMTLPRTVSGVITGYHPPDAFFTVVAMPLFSLAAFAFMRYYRHDVVSWLKRQQKQ